MLIVSGDSYLNVTLGKNADVCLESSVVAPEHQYTLIRRVAEVAGLHLEVSVLHESLCS